MVDINKLSRLTREAIQRGKEEAARIEAEKLAAAERKRKAERRKAENVIEQIPDRAEKEAKAGRTHAIVYALKSSEDYTTGYNQWHAREDNLCGVGKLVWDYCVGAGLKPTIEDWHDGVGINSGYNIVIHWEA